MGYSETPSSSITFEKRLTQLQNKFLNIYLTLKNISEVFKLQVFALNDTFPTSMYSMGLFIETLSSSITFEKRLTPLQNKFLNVYLTLKNISEVFKLQVFALNDTFPTSLYSMGFSMGTPSTSLAFQRRLTLLTHRIHGS